MSLPKDPVMLLSVVNTRLRDIYPDLLALCEAEDVSEDEIMAKLAEAGYQYDPEKRQFV